MNNETKFTEIGIKFAKDCKLTEERIHVIVAKYAKYKTSSMWTVGDAILQDPRCTKSEVPAFVLRDYEKYFGRRTQWLSACVRTCKLWPYKKRDKEIPFAIYKYLSDKWHKFGKSFIDATYRKYIDEKWTTAELRSYIHQEELKLKRDRFKKNNSPEAKNEVSGSSQGVNPSTSARYALEKDPSEFYVVDKLLGKTILAHFPFKINNQASKNLAETLAKLCLDYLISQEK